MKILWITKNASNNLTGGTKVSWNYRSEIKNTVEFGELTLLAKNNFDTNVTISRLDFIKQFRKLRKEHFDFVFFDDHYSFLSLFIKKKNSLLFYHGNWPDLMFTSVNYFIKGLFLYPLYLIGMMSVKKVIFVNPYFETKFKKIAKTTTTLFNPLSIDVHLSNSKKSTEILMVGNVDSRKYNNLLKLLDNKKYSKHVFVIYGKIIDKNIASKLSKYSNVVLKGMVNRIPYEEYTIHFSCSKAENLPLSLFEALKNNLLCIYPKLPNYNFLFDNDNIMFYENLAAINFEDQKKRVNMKDSDTFDFLKVTYSNNLKTLLKDN